MLPDLILVTGIGLLGLGLYLVYPPAALIVIGCILIAISLAAYFPPKKPDPS